MKIVYSLLLLLVVMSSCTPEPKMLESHPTATTLFTASEIQSISNFSGFFEDYICKNNSDVAVEKCYEAFLKRLSKTMETGRLELNIPFDEQEYVYETMDDALFHQIWTFGKQWSSHALDTFRVINLVPDGQYAAFLKETAKDHPLIEQYHKELQAAHTITPSMLTSFVVNHDRLDLKDVRVRLIVAIHFLTLNDLENRKELY